MSKPRCIICDIRLYYMKCPNSKCFAYGSDQSKIKVINGLKDRKQRKSNKQPHLK